MRGVLLALPVVLVAAGLVHGRAVLNNLPRHHWEDWRFFRHNRTHVHSPVDCFTKAPVWPGLYRPLTTNCYYLAGRVLWRNRVEAYHAVNAALYVGNGLLFFAIARTLLPLPLALLASALWVSRVAHRQLLLYTSEFQGLFATLLSLAALGLALTGRRRGLALALFAAALLSKESAVALPAIVSAATWLFAPRSWRRDVAWWAVAAGWAVAFALVLRGVSGWAPTGYNYDVSGAIGTRYAAYALMFSNAIVLPVDDWAVPARIPALAASVWVLVPLALAGLALTALLAAARRLPEGAAAMPLRVMAFGFAWFVAGSAPFVVFEDRLFLRYAYFGAAGLALVLSALPAAAAEWWRFKRRPAAASAAATAPTPGPAPP